MKKPLPKIAGLFVVPGKRAEDEGRKLHAKLKKKAARPKGGK